MNTDNKKIFDSNFPLALRLTKRSMRNITCLDNYQNVLMKTDFKEEYFVTSYKLSITKRSVLIGNNK